VTQHAWQPGHFRLFVSHISARKDVAGALHDGLADYYIDAFVAHETIAPTNAWQDEIEDALATCHGSIAILSDGFKESDWCDQEVGVCFGRGILVLAVNDGLNPYGFIGRFQAFNPLKYANNDDLWRALYEVFRDHERSREAMAGALVHKFENSDSYAEARNNMDELKTVPREAWNDPLLDRIEKAHESNRQIDEANYRFQHGVPTEARRFVNGIRTF